MRVRLEERTKRHPFFPNRLVFERMLFEQGKVYEVPDEVGKELLQLTTHDSGEDYYTFTETTAPPTGDGKPGLPSVQHNAGRGDLKMADTVARSGPEKKPDRQPVRAGQEGPRRRTASRAKGGPKKKTARKKGAPKAKDGGHEV